MEIEGRETDTASKNKIPATKTICLAQSLNRKDIFSILWANLSSHGLL